MARETSEHENREASSDSEYSLLDEGSVHTLADSPSKLDWDDFVFRYDAAGDAFRIFFVETSSETIASKDALIPSVHAARDGEGKISFLEITDARKSVAFHLYDLAEPLRGLLPPVFTSTYDAVTDALYVQFVDFHGKVHDTVHDKNYDIVFDVIDGRYVGFEILHASELLRKRAKNGHPRMHSDAHCIY